MRASPLMELGSRLMRQPNAWQVRLKAVHARIGELKGRGDDEQTRRDLAAAKHAAKRIEDQRRTVLLTAALLAREPIEVANVH